MSKTKLQKGGHFGEQAAGADDYDDGTKEVIIKLKSFFVRRTNIYFVDVKNQIKKINNALVKMKKPLKKCVRVDVPLVEA